MNRCAEAIKPVKSISVDLYSIHVLQSIVLKGLVAGNRTDFSTELDLLKKKKWCDALWYQDFSIVSPLLLIFSCSYVPVLSESFSEAKPSACPSMQCTPRMQCSPGFQCTPFPGKQPELLFSQSVCFLPLHY